MLRIRGFLFFSKLIYQHSTGHNAGNTGRNPALFESVELVCAPFHAGVGQGVSVHRLVRSSTGEHSEEKDTHLQACLLQGAGLREEGSGEPLLGLAGHPL